MFKRYVEYSKALFTTVKQDSKVATPATIAAMSFVYYATANDTTEEQKRAIPTFVLQSKDNTELPKATQLQGILWLTGYLAK